MKIAITLLAACAILAGCATPSPEREAKMAEARRTTPICRSEKDCAAKWDAAQLWIVKNAGYKIQTATNVVIQTYNSVNGDVGLQVQVTREPVGDGSYRIVALINCDNVFRCSQPLADALLDFNKTVGSTRIGPAQ